MFVNCLVDAFVKPGERLIGIGMFANIIPINILQVVNERFCIESRIVTNLSFVVWKEWFTSSLSFSTLCNCNVAVHCTILGQ